MCFLPNVLLRTKMLPAYKEHSVSVSEHVFLKEMRISHCKIHEEFAKKSTSADAFSAHLLISPGQGRHELEHCDPPGSCACSHEVVEAAQQLHHRDGFRLSLKEETPKIKT